MSKKCVLVDPSLPASVLEPEVDWRECILCQQRTAEKLLSPDQSKRQDAMSGYQSLVDMLYEFEKVGELPSRLMPDRLDDGNGLASTLQSKNGRWHKTCRAQFCTRELDRRSQRAEKRTMCESVDEADDSINVSLPPVKRCTRSEHDAGNTLKAQIEVCFFCDLSAEQQPLHAVTTFDLDARVKQCASDLGDNRLLAKLAVGDMIALEAKYHSHCLAQLYNRRRSLERQQYHTVVTGNVSDSQHSTESIVFAQLIAYINDVRSCDIIPVFKLADLKTLYITRLNQLNSSHANTVNSSRLKEKLLAYYPDMRAQSDGRDVLLTFNDHLGAALSKACSGDMDEDAMRLMKAAEVVRRNMFDCKWQFGMSWSQDAQLNSVPPALLCLIKMIMEGPSIDVQSSHQQTQAASLSVAQLVVFNSVRHKRTSPCPSHVTRHAKGQETPLPLYIGLAVHAATRKKRLIDKLFDLGICVSYDRVLSVLNDIACGVCDRFEADNLVCPLNFSSDVFTTAAVDNIDHNLSATTAHSSFHGTGISLHQHPDAEMFGTERTVFCPRTDATRQDFRLPAIYSVVPQIKLLKQEPALPDSSSGTASCSLDSYKTHDRGVSDDEWLQDVWSKWDAGTFGSDVVCSWSKFYSERVQPAQHTLNVTVSSMLPLFHEQAHSVSMIKHAMNVVKSSVAKLNPGQIPVIAFDQPLFTIAKLIQWNWPDIHGEEKLVVMFGGLHVEMAALKALGSLLTSSGWAEAIADAGFVTSGSAEGLLSASHMKRCRRAHEVTLASLFVLQRLAFGKLCDAQLTFDEWRCQQSIEHCQFAFWTHVMKFQTAILLFVRSLREANFALYVESLKNLMPWFFVLDRTNYARWLSVHIRDMQSLPSTHPSVFGHFSNGKFTVNKSRRSFSALPIDQAHEQLNAVVKGDGGVIGLTDNDTALGRYMLTGPEVARLIDEFESEFSVSVTSAYHHENTKAFQESFVSDVQKLVTSFERFGNPFEDKNDLVVIHSRKVIPKEDCDSVFNLHTTGRDQYERFVNTRLVDASESLFAPIKRNKISLFYSSKPAKSKTQTKLAAARNDAALFSRLYIACQIRNSDLEQFFAHENQVYPPALSDAGQLYFGCKSDLLSCLEPMHPSIDVEPQVDGIVLDGAVIVNMLKPTNVKTFEEYAGSVFMPYIYSQLSKVRRLDIVWDRYLLASVKGSMRAKRGCAARQQVNSSAPVPRNWQEFLRNDDNKAALFCYLADQICMKQIPNGKVLVSTCEESVKSTHVQCRFDTSNLQPCTHEEADTRMLLHAADIVRGGLDKVLIRTVDTDVVVLAIAFVDKIRCTHLWIAFGTGQHFRYISIHELASALGPQSSCALSVFHALTGCDTVSAFVGRGKKTCWETWKKFPEVSLTFVELFNSPLTGISDTHIDVLQRFIVMLYDATCSCRSVNAARRKLFAGKGKPLEHIPPTLDALVQHIKRAVFQTCVWSQSLVVKPSLPSPSDWGWCVVEGTLQPLWMTIPDMANCCPELKRCGCKTGCLTKRCRCVKDNISCTALCACDGECRQ